MNEIISQNTFISTPSNKGMQVLVDRVIDSDEKPELDIIIRNMSDKYSTYKITIEKISSDFMMDTKDELVLENNKFQLKDK